jgi:hypothetical protein
MLSQDDQLSLREMEAQEREEDRYTSPVNTVLRLDQFVIHAVNPEVEDGMRTFAKISISRDKYDLEGNSKNYELNYEWPMRPRSPDRNVPQEL